VGGLPTARGEAERERERGGDAAKAARRSVGHVLLPFR
jgi:hypothetical protein